MTHCRIIPFTRDELEQAIRVHNYFVAYPHMQTAFDIDWDVEYYDRLSTTRVNVLCEGDKIIVGLGNEWTECGEHLPKVYRAVIYNHDFNEYRKQPSGYFGVG